MCSNANQSSMLKCAATPTSLRCWNEQQHQPVFLKKQLTQRWRKSFQQTKKHHGNQPYEETESQTTRQFQSTHMNQKLLKLILKRYFSKTVTSKPTHLHSSNFQLKYHSHVKDETHSLDCRRFSQPKRYVTRLCLETRLESLLGVMWFRNSEVSACLVQLCRYTSFNLIQPLSSVCLFIGLSKITVGMV